MARTRVIAVVRFGVEETRYLLKIMTWAECGVLLSRMG